MGTGRCSLFPNKGLDEAMDRLPWVLLVIFHLCFNFIKSMKRTHLITDTVTLISLFSSHLREEKNQRSAVTHPSSCETNVAALSRLRRAADPALRAPQRQGGPIHSLMESARATDGHLGTSSPVCNRGMCPASGAVTRPARGPLQAHSDSSTFLSCLKPEELESPSPDFLEAQPNRGTCVEGEAREGEVSKIGRVALGGQVAWQRGPAAWFLVSQVWGGGQSLHGTSFSTVLPELRPLSC